MIFGEPFWSAALAGIGVLAMFVVVILETVTAREFGHFVY